MAAMPVGVKLECSRRFDHGEVVSRTSHELQANGKIIFSKATRHGESGKAAQIANPAQRIGKGEIGLKIHVERRRGNRERSSNEYVERVKKRFHLFL